MEYECRRLPIRIAHPQILEPPRSPCGHPWRNSHGYEVEDQGQGQAYLNPSVQSIVH
jgi:hypothetical protein